MVTNPALFPLTRRVADVLIRMGYTVCELTGQAVEVLRLASGFLVRGRLSAKHWVTHAAFIGVDSLGIALILTLFSGMVIALQVAQELTRQGAGELVGALVAISILRELAPIMTGFGIIAMVGSSYAAELATMNIQKQVDALKMLHVHPVRYLVLPRVMAAVFAVPLMTLLTAMAGIVGGMVISHLIADLNINRYLESVWQQVETKDIVGTMLKGATFGLLIALISTTIGLNTKGGAKEVGEATTKAVVWSFVAMALADYALSFILFGGGR